MKRFAFAFLAVLVSSHLHAQEAPKAAEPEKAAEPFAFADFTWLNGNSRQKESILDSKYFTGEVLVDANYIYDFNHPKDHTLIGSTSAGRTQELQVEQFGVGGDFHYQNVRARLLTQFGMYSTMTPRNDGSPQRGQWDLSDAYRYISEAYGGYHWDTWNGINLDAGIFMSYIGLFSYYNVENWAYQASYVSANTPWFFNGLRLQTFPSDKLKLEFWLINGWQSYGMYNEQPGLGMQTLWRPKGYFSLVSNDYWGTDTINNPGRQRFHSDNSIEVKYIDKPTSFLSKAAFSLTGDIGCETGGGVTCTGGDANTPSQYFLGFMAYNRFWFAHDKYAITLGGGAFNNPGRYLVLIPPTQTSTPGPTGGATAVTGATNFPTGPGTSFHAWDTSVTFDYMPNQFITWRAEFNHREADTPYFAGGNGVSDTNGNNYDSPFNAQNPDYVKSETRLNFAMMVRF